MGMTIDLALDIFKHPTDYFPSEREEAWDYAIEVMQKYQQIKEQVDIAIDKENFEISGARLIQIREIIDGTDD